MSPVELIQQQVDAYNALDLEAFLAAYADDAVIVNEGRIMMNGKTAMRERYSKLFRENLNQRVTITRRQVQGNVVTDWEHVTGRANGMEIRAIARYEVEDGLIRRVTFLPAK
jgi:uncharacterized protein (TIGR02246 family)